MTDAICLITAPVLTDYEDPHEALSQQIRAIARAPKLGVLALASALERAGLQPLVFDLDDAYAEYLADSSNRGLQGFPAWVTPKIAACGSRLFGFSSICGSYPITIRIAEALKRETGDCTTLFGGPQASATDLATLAAFPFVDFILRGEADLSLPGFVEQWSGKRLFSDVPGLTWRSAFGPQRNPDAPVIDNLDDLPLPAFHLSSLNKSDHAFLELGRGCPFACTFCSTNDFFRRKFRVKSPARILADMRAVAGTYGFRSFNLVHDMFTVDRHRVVAFCEAMLAANEGFRWSCSARTDCVDPALLELMARAGCNDIFFGVETGSKRMQRIIDKDLDPAEARAAVEACERLGMSTTVSTIVGFPEETEADLCETLDVFMHAMRQPNSTPQVNILAPLSATPIYSKYKDQMFLGEISSHLSYPGRSQSPADRDLVHRYPAIFPNFYMLPTPCLDRACLQELAEFLPMARRKLRWLLVALYRRCQDVLTFFRPWRQHRMAIHPNMHGSDLRLYYTRDNSINDFVAFVRTRMEDFGDPAVEALLSCQEALAWAAANPPIAQAGSLVSGRIAASSIPVRAPGIHVMELDFDVRHLVESLQRNAPASVIPMRTYYRTTPPSDPEVRLMEITPLVAGALLLCDGVRTVAKFAASAEPLFDCPDQLRHYAAQCLLKRLRAAELVEIRRPFRRSPSRSLRRTAARAHADGYDEPLASAASVSPGVLAK